MDDTTRKTLEDTREGLLSLARAHRNVIPPPAVTATACAEMAGTLARLLKATPDQPA